MKNVTLFFIERPILVNFILAINFIFGAYFIYKVPKEAFPGVSMNQIVIVTKYPGASAKDVELNITTKIEDKIAEIGNIKEFRSSSIESVSRITIFANDDLNDGQFKDLLADVQTDVDKIDDFPSDVEGQPVITSVTTEDRPIMEIAFSGSYDLLKDKLPKIENSLRQVSGVSNVVSVGLPDEEIHIEVNAKKAQEREIDLNSIYYAIHARNQVGTGGTLESFISQKKVVSFNKYEKAQDVLNTVIRMSPDGNGVLLGDVADITYRAKNEKLIVRNNGARGASILVAIRSGVDQLKVSDKIKDVLKQQDLPKGVSYLLNNDISENARSKFTLLKNNGLIGFILVVTLLFYFLGAKPAFWTAFGIPFTIFGSMILFVPLGMTLNSVSMGAFVIVLGMIVDDAMVISERFDVNIEQGQTPNEAASNAVGRLWRPVLAASLTTITAFMPLLALGGLPGKFIWQMPAVVMMALFVSLIDCYLLLPAHLAHGSKSGHQYDKNKLILAWENIYSKILSKLLDYRYFVIAGFLGFFLFSVFIGATKVRKDSFPQEASEGFTIKVTLEKGYAAEKVEQIIKDVEGSVTKLAENELVGYTARLGTHSLSSLTNFGTEENLVTFLVYLTDYGERKRTANQMIDSIKADIGKQFLERGFLLEFNLMRVGPPLGEPFEIIVSSNLNDARDNASTKVMRFLKGIKGVFAVKDDYVPGKDEINLKLNYKKVAQAGLTPADIIRTIRIAFDGQIVTDFSSINKSYDFRLRLDKESRGDLDFISNLPIANKRGQLIKLKTMIDYEQRPSYAEIKHYNGVRSTSVTGNIKPKIITAVEMLNVFKTKFQKEKDIIYTISGRPVEEAKIFAGLKIAAGLALIGIYFILSLMFNSYSKPLLILAVIPFGIVGIFLSFYAHHLPISMFAGIGLIGLSGIVVNDSIVLVDHISQLMKDNGGFSKELLVRGAKERLRPISLTTMSTVLAVAPTAYAIGGYDPLLSPLSLAILYGLLFGTTVVLLFMPSLYFIGDDISKKLGKKKTAQTGLTGLVVFFVMASSLVPIPVMAQEKLNLATIINLVEKTDEFKIQDENLAQAQLLVSGVDGMLDGKLSTKIYQYSFENYRNPPITLDSKKEGSGISIDYDQMTSYGFKYGLGIGFEDKELGTVPTNNQFSLDTTESVYKASLVIPLWRNLGSKEYHLKKETTSLQKRGSKQKIRSLKDQTIVDAIKIYWTLVKLDKEKYIAKQSLHRFLKLHRLNVIKRKSGIISKAEILTSEVEVTGRKRSFNDITSKIEIEKIKLRSILQLEKQDVNILISQMSGGDQFIKISDKQADQFIEQGLTYSLSKLNIDTFDSLLKQEKEMAKSNMDLFVSFKSYGRGDDTGEAFDENTQDKVELYTGLTWSFDFGKHKSTSQVGKVLSQKRQAKLKESQVLSQLKFGFREVKKKASSNLTQISFLKTIKSQQLAILQAEKKRFKNGKITTLDYVKLQEALDRSLLQIINLNYANEMNVLMLYQVIGKMDLYLQGYDVISKRI